MMVLRGVRDRRDRVSISEMHRAGPVASCLNHVDTRNGYVSWQSVDFWNICFILCDNPHLCFLFRMLCTVLSVPSPWHLGSPQCGLQWTFGFLPEVVLMGGIFDNNRMESLTDEHC